ncbi:uncharacterized protein [Arachis hypogaea]|uniref:uncharacterized protein n=1 Tax=Arachis hypogaea TaxID=3818 RepID=UPI003B2138C2
MSDERELPSTRRHHRVRGGEEEREREEEAVAVAVRAPSSLPFVNQTPSPSEALAAAENPITVRSIASPLGGFEGGEEADSITPAAGGGTSCATAPLSPGNAAAAVEIHCRSVSEFFLCYGLISGCCMSRLGLPPLLRGWNGLWL